MKIRLLRVFKKNFAIRYRRDIGLLSVHVSWWILWVWVKWKPYEEHALRLFKTGNYSINTCAWPAKSKWVKP